MTFSTYAWQLYRDSPHGRVAMARDVRAHAAALPVVRDAPAFEYPVLLRPPEPGGEGLQPGTAWMDLRAVVREQLGAAQVSSVEEADALFARVAEEGLTWPAEAGGIVYQALYGGGAADDEGYADIYASIEGLTAGLHDCFPDVFAPYLFARRFDEFRRLCDRYAIAIPDVPGKRQKRARALYYVGLNRAL
jgi:hypothetical protein